MTLRIIVFVFLTLNMQAQYEHIPVFPNLEGANLRSALISAYKPVEVLTLTEARDTLYKRVFLENDSVKCVYTGLTKYLDPNEDPSQYLFQNGGNEDINLEHGYPRSKGADAGSASSNMHHLFPTRVSVNSARGNDPMTELNDNQTDKWYYKNLTSSQIPTSHIDKYSEDNDAGFEPREDFKGNIARAYFYFYTMYENEAFAADPNFFESQIVDLCRWHDKDPVDSLEWLRNYRIASYQSDKVNPFIFDCSLARLFCSNIVEECGTVQVNEPKISSVIIYPNLVFAGNPFKIERADNSDSALEIRLFDMSGRMIELRNVSSQGRFIEFLAPQQKGVYLLQVMSKGELLGSQKLFVL